MCQQAVQTPAFPVSCSRVGRWWYSGEEIDVVGLNHHTDTLLLGECKWTSAPVGRAVFDDLTALASSVRWHGDDRNVRYALFSRAGFTDELQTVAYERPEVYLYGLTELAALFD